MRECRPHHPHDAEDIHLIDAEPFVVVIGGDITNRANAGAVDHDVEPAQCLDGGCNRGVDRRLIGDVGPNRHRGATRRRRFVAIEDRDLCAAFCQPDRAGRTDSRGAPGDQCDQAVEIEAH